ncbi:MAG TPA: VOC family protein [Terriglobales bacterium]|nr:VOC family protein [Terriglobales bacterium]
MKRTAQLVVVLVGLASLSAAQTKQEGMKNMNLKKITPVLYVNEVEPCVQFWTERFGFQKTAEVPDGDRLGFVILQKNDLELMYQSFASARKDAPAIATEIEGGRTFLYMEVEKLEPFIAATKNANVVLPLRTTFYGAKEIGVKDPAGHVVVFAEMTAPH